MGYVLLWRATTAMEPIDAFLVWNEVVEARPEACAAWYWLGRACARAGQAGKAEACYAKALALAPADEALRAAVTRETSAPPR